MVPLLLLMLAALAATVVAFALYINWVQYIKLSNEDDSVRNGGDKAYGVCLFKDYLAVVGGANLNPFVALLDRSTGEVVKTRIGKSGKFLNCLSIGDKLYVVKISNYLWHGVYVFDEELNVLKKARFNGVPYAISFDGSYLYLAGYMRKDVNEDGLGDEIWRIEKRTLDLGLVNYRKFYMLKSYRECAWDSLSLEAYDIAVNPATGDLWAVGKGDISYGKMARSVALIVIFDRELDVKRVVEYPSDHVNYLGGLYGVCFDDYGKAYVVGGVGVAKFDESGKVLAVNRGVGGFKIACVGGRVYVFGVRRVDGYRRHVLYVLDERLNLLDKLVLSRGVEANSDFWYGRPAFDGKDLYVAGKDEALGRNNKRVVVYSISVPTARVDV